MPGTEDAIELSEKQLADGRTFFATSVTGLNLDDFVTCAAETRKLRKRNCHYYHLRLTVVRLGRTSDFVDNKLRIERRASCLACLRQWVSAWLSTDWDNDEAVAYLQRRLGDNMGLSTAGKAESAVDSDSHS